MQATFVLILAAAQAFGQAPAADPVKATPAPVSLRELSLSLEQLAARVRPSVVQVFTTGYAPPGEGESTDANNLLNRQRGTGSGVILSADGYIITNSHVVENGTRIQVKLPVSNALLAERGSSVRPQGKTVAARIVGVDRESDLAVLKVEQTGLSFLRLSDSDRLRQGQLVIAFGNPLGLEGSVSMGVVSSVARQIRQDDVMVYVQTDAPINPGNSGGPLIDSQGRVVGINTFILSQSGGSEGIGFAVPSNIVTSVYQQIKKDGHVHRGQIGVYAQTITPLLARGLKLPQDWGVILADIYPDGPAAKAGLRPGDLVLSLNGKAMENARQLEVNIYRQLLREKVDLEILRDGKKTHITVPVVERNDDPMRFIDMVDPVKNLVPKLGILGIAINEEMASMLSVLRYQHGVVVAARSSEAAANGLKPGDVIYSLNGTPSVSILALNAALNETKPGDALVLQIQRGERVMFVTIEME